jgi:hypothetical protein
MASCTMVLIHLLILHKPEPWECASFPPAKNEKSVFGWPSAPPEFSRHFSHISPTFLPHLLPHVYDNARDCGIFPRFLPDIPHFPTCNDFTRSHTIPPIQVHKSATNNNIRCWIIGSTMQVFHFRVRGKVALFLNGGRFWRLLWMAAVYGALFERRPFLALIVDGGRL